MHFPTTNRGALIPLEALEHSSVHSSGLWNASADSLETGLA